jgi:hypothetical protein
VKLSGCYRSWNATPRLITAHWYTLEHLILACMERAYGAQDTRSKMTATAIEYQARLLRERVKGCQN